MWHRLKEGEWLGRGIRNEREAEKKPSSQKQLSMTIRGQTTGEEEDPEQRDSAALTVHELDVQFLLLLIYFNSSSSFEKCKAFNYKIFRPQNGSLGIKGICSAA